jgi:N6-adenosine-specific RNA methylase IME4
MQIQLPEGKFKCIVADPPWDYSEHGCCDGPPKPWKDILAGQKTVADMGYPVMRTADIAEMPVSKTVESNAHLYLWTVNKFLREAHEVAESWGFRPMTLLTWGKVKADGTASMKTGYYFRGATEHCLFAVRGSLPLQVKHGKPTLYLSRRLPHSVKPEWFYALCEECSPGPRLELFARRVRPGWTCWGNEVNQDARAGQGECPGTACNSASTQIALDI